MRNPQDISQRTEKGDTVMSIEARSRQYGKVFDHWQIKEFLGSGSGGKTAVFRLARIDSGWGDSALKVVNLIQERGDINTLPDSRKLEYKQACEDCSKHAEQEVRLMDDLRGNTNIVDYLDHTFVDWSDELGFGRDLLIRMELLKDLRSQLKNGREFTEDEILKIGQDICSALIRCHRKNILHRDVKPENIFCNRDGDYKLGDFGVSRVLDACPGAMASTGIGTYEYWPADQMTGRYDQRVDIYSLGLVLYELSNRNRLPFAVSTYATTKEVSLRLSGVPLPAPVNASPELTTVILKACAHRPEDRYQSAEAFLNALNSVVLIRKAQPEFDYLSQIQVPSQDRYETLLACGDAQLPREDNNAFPPMPATDAGSFSGELPPTQLSEANTDTTPERKTPGKKPARLLMISGMCVLALVSFVIGLFLSRSGKIPQPQSGPDSVAATQKNPASELPAGDKLIDGSWENGDITVVALKDRSLWIRITDDRPEQQYEDLGTPWEVSFDFGEYLKYGDAQWQVVSPFCFSLSSSAHQTTLIQEYHRGNIPEYSATDIQKNLQFKKRECVDNGFTNSQITYFDQQIERNGNTYTATVKLPEWFDVSAVKDLMSVSISLHDADYWSNFYGNGSAIIAECYEFYPLIP